MKVTSKRLDKGFAEAIRETIYRVEVRARTRKLSISTSALFDAARKGRTIERRYPHVRFDHVFADGGCVPNSYDYAAKTTRLTLGFDRATAVWHCEVRRTYAQSRPYGRGIDQSIVLWAPVGNSEHPGAVREARKQIKGRYRDAYDAGSEIRITW